MRISDWSSDVCSSDLRQHAVEHVDAAPDRADDVGGLADAHEVARPLGRQVRHRHVERLEHRRLAFADGEPADRVAVEADLLQRLGRALAQLRSEEHTSELQSLMRISYAVFCLKKKQKKT